MGNRCFIAVRATSRSDGVGSDYAGTLTDEQEDAAFAFQGADGLDDDLEAFLLDLIAQDRPALNDLLAFHWERGFYRGGTRTVPTVPFDQARAVGQCRRQAQALDQGTSPVPDRAKTPRL